MLLLEIGEFVLDRWLIGRIRCCEQTLLVVDSSLEFCDRGIASIQFSLNPLLGRLALHGYFQNGEESANIGTPKRSHGK